MLCITSQRLGKQALRSHIQLLGRRRLLWGWGGLSQREQQAEMIDRNELSKK